MKKYYLLVLTALAYITAMAQVEQMTVNVNGDFEIYVTIGNDEFVVLDSWGEIIDINTEKRIDFYSDFNDYEAGKIKSIGGLRFDYYSDFNDYEEGKIKSIGDVRFRYYSDFNDYEEGKIKSVGGVEFDYYSDFNDYETGKLKSIGNSSNRYTYFPDHVTNERLAGRLQSGKRQFRSNGIDFMVTDRTRRHRPEPYFNR